MKVQRYLPTAAMALILLLYLITATQYAILTPAWQAPDEPAHYNYVRYVAEHGTLPTLQPGDFPAAYLEEIKSRRFPSEMSIEPLRYESWQPPLYYILATPIYFLTAGRGPLLALLALRLFSVVLGALLLVVTYRFATALMPERRACALLTVALVATIPMHVATTAAVSNDTLAELLVGLLLWQLVRRVQDPALRLHPWLFMGLTLGLAALTKLSTLATLPLVLGVLVYIWRRRMPQDAHPAPIKPALATLLPAFVLVAPWLARNMAVYGLTDPLVIARHALVVTGQERTADWLAQVGLLAGGQEMLLTTFHSFWGQFGWMGVPIDERLYRMLALFSGLCALGLALRIGEVRRAWHTLSPSARAAWLLIPGSILLTTATYIGYNLGFRQHQGRYLFPALIPLAILLALGWWQITLRRHRVPIAAFLVLAGLAMAVGALLQDRGPDKRLLTGILALAGAFGLGAILPERWARWLPALPYPLLLALDLLCLYRFIIPNL